MGKNGRSRMQKKRTAKGKKKKGEYARRKMYSFWQEKLKEQENRAKCWANIDAKWRIK